MPMGEPKCGMCGSDLMAGMFHHCTRPVECQNCESMKLQLNGLQKAVESFVYKANFTPPWESSGSVWGEMCKRLNNALIDSREPEKRNREGDGHICVAAEFVPCPVCGRKIGLSR